ncbi:class II aldolase/adducin family protein [Roseospirillum parvum]|uniref:L-fuculose-phosphate aldolase n=1 Tax=Roseospirillum parvum TaxID=83401 RepID=A0A1G7WEJ7_9PROT|nr:class II aldolase/adducin family protein [Roseospirillum parvum]SDG70402.1 L-fuculose-phosphate aldolase [Roseospirillum parvum]
MNGLPLRRDRDLVARHQLIDTARELTRRGLRKTTAGNLSVRAGEGLLLTPSGMQSGDLTPRDLPFMDLDGNWEGPLKPSSEWRFHRDILANRPEVGAVIHTHAPFCTTLACHQRGIPAFHYMVGVAGGTDIRCAPYATFGTPELCQAALQALDGRKACLLAHHGMIALGKDLKSALKLTIEVEELAEQYWRCLQLGDPPLLSDAEMSRVLDRFTTYGQTQAAEVG